MSRSLSLGVVLMAVLASLCGNTASADQPDTRWYVNPALNYIVTDEDRFADNRVGVQLGVGRALGESWNLEWNLVADRIGRKNGGNYDQIGLGLDALYFLYRDPGFAPYGLLGLGALRTQVPGVNSCNLMANAGAGFLFQLTENGMALRPEVRYRLDRDRSSVPGIKQFGDWLLNVGLTIPLGERTKPKEAPAPKPLDMIFDSDHDGVLDGQDRCPNTAAGIKVGAQGCELDSDGDGVRDSQDQCPNTAAGVKVNAQGCELDSDGDGVLDGQDRCPNTAAGAKVDAQGCVVVVDGDADGDTVPDSLDQCPNTVAGARINSQGCEVDSDMDGVLDSQDQCPNTAAGAKVNAQGCELDSDGDGVVDSRDRCPGTMTGIKVDDSGCEVPEVIVLKGVKFETNSAQLTAGSSAVLNEAAQTLVDHGQIQIEVAGYTDSRGLAEKNRALSQRRAEAVMQYLVSRGVPAERIQAKGYGADSPVADNTTPEGMAQNRRVELHILRQ